jgi:hypothetical protein
MWFPITAVRAWLQPKAVQLILLVSLAIFLRTATQGTEYIENFDQAGRPADQAGITWNYTAELSPVKDWSDLIPGDGFAYLSVEHSSLNHRHRRGKSWPFQTLAFGPVGPGHRISMRARNTAIPGVAALLFTYHEEKHVDEIDIEIVADDTRTPETGHLTGPEVGWTDARFNTWAQADKTTLQPGRHLQQPIRNESGQKVSHRDNHFHVYTIEWRPDEVRFIIDGVLQATIHDLVPQTASTVIFGLRQMPWAGTPDWTDSQTMLVDWVSVEPLD